MTKSSLSLFLFKMLLLAFFLTTALLLLLALLMYKLKWGNDLIRIGVYATYFLACFLPTLLTGKKMRSRRLLWGLAVSALYFVLFFTVAAALGTGLFAAPGRLVTVLGLCLAGGAFGGIVS